jgi:metal-dependent amidase/aminoacylase/carboxypeptidase family protein
LSARLGGVVGDDMVWQIPPASPSDDMSVFLNMFPGAYIFVGAGLADGSSGMHHSLGLLR